MPEHTTSFRAYIEQDTEPRLIHHPVIKLAQDTQAGLQAQHFDNRNDAVARAVATANKLDAIAVQEDLIHQPAFLHGFDIVSAEVSFDPDSNLHIIKNKILEPDTDTPGDVPILSGSFLGFTGIAQELHDGSFVPELRYQIDTNQQQRVLPTVACRLLAHTAVSPPGALEFLQDRRKDGVLQATEVLLANETFQLQALLHNINALLPQETDWLLPNVKTAARLVRLYLEENETNDAEKDAILDFTKHRLALYEGQAIKIAAYGAIRETDEGRIYWRNLAIEGRVLDLVFGCHFFFQKSGTALNVNKNSMQITAEIPTSDGQGQTWNIPFEKILAVSYAG